MRQRYYGLVSNCDDACVLGDFKPPGDGEWGKLAFTHKPVSAGFVVPLHSKQSGRLADVMYAKPLSTLLVSPAVAAVFSRICAAGEIQVVDATLDDAPIAHKVIHCLKQYDCIDNSRSAMTRHGPQLVLIEEQIGSAAVFRMENGTEFVAVREDLAYAVNDAAQTEVGFVRLKVLSGGSGREATDDSSHML